MAVFGSMKEIEQFVKERRQAADPTRGELAEHVTESQSWYQGDQWRAQGWRSGAQAGGTTSNYRYRANMHPDRGPVLAVSNKTTMFVQKVQAATFPSYIYATCGVPDQSVGPEVEQAASTHETIVNALIEDTNYLDAARDANDNRCVAGTWCMGVRLESAGELGVRLCVYDADPTCLILDPAVRSRNLDNHSAVIYYDAWTKADIERYLGIKIPDDKLKKIRELEPKKVEMAGRTQGSLFSRYARDAETLGALVTQVHCKDESGRWKYLYVLVELQDKTIWVNEDDPASPFGAQKHCPIQLFHANKRPDSPWSWSDVAQVKEDQAKINLAESIYWRAAIPYASIFWRIDRRYFKKQQTDEQIMEGFTNRTVNFLIGDMGDRMRNHSAPDVVQMPPPPPFLKESIERYEVGIEKKSHRAPIHSGQTPTHVPLGATQMARDEADQPLGVRVKGDMASHTRLLSVLHGTAIRLAQGGNPHTLGILSGAGLQDEDFTIVAGTDPSDSKVSITISESSIRYRSHNMVKADLQWQAQQQLIDPEDFHAAMADELDSPATATHRTMRAEARKSAMRVLAGEEWIPKPLGKWTQVFIDQFIMAMHSRQAKRDPETLQRCIRAVQSQEMFIVQSAQAMGAGQPETQQAEPGTMSPADMLESAMVGAQTAA